MTHVDKCLKVFQLEIYIGINNPPRAHVSAMTRYDWSDLTYTVAVTVAGKYQYYKDNTHSVCDLWSLIEPVQI